MTTCMPCVLSVVCSYVLCVCFLIGVCDLVHGVTSAHYHNNGRNEGSSLLSPCVCIQDVYVMLMHMYIPLTVTLHPIVFDHRRMDGW